jgi:lysine 2,3-aminomutase
MNDIAVAESAPDLDPQEPPPPSAVGFDPAEARRRLYGDVSDADWSDWRWQLRNRLRDRDDLERAFVLSGSERATIDGIGGRLPVGITPYYATLMNPLDPNDPLRRTLVPLDGELVRSPGEENDPLGEDADSAGTPTVCCSW